MSGTNAKLTKAVETYFADLARRIAAIVKMNFTDPA